MVLWACSRPANVVLILQNDLGEAMLVRLMVGDRVLAPTLPADSFNTFVAQP
jgi:glucosylceramidase